MNVLLHTIQLKNECTFDEESLPFSKNTNIHHEERLLKRSF